MHHIFKKLFIFLISCYTLTAFSQEKYIQYYQAINQAELAICDSNFSQATQYYKQAFQINPDKPFTAHLLNAFHAAMDSKEYSIAEKYMAKVLSRGLSSDYIQEKILPPYKTPQQSVIKNILAKHPNDTIHNQSLVKKLNSLLEWEQSVKKYYSKLNKGAYMVDSVFTVDSVIAVELKKIFDKYSVPNEDILGNIGAYNNSKYGLKGFDVLLLFISAGHYGGRPSHIFDTLLFKAVKNLDFEAHSFTQILTKHPISNSFIFRNTTILFPLNIKGAYYDRKIYPEYFDKVSEQKINAERAKLGLESLDDYRRKIDAYNNAKNKTTALSKYSFALSMIVKDIESAEGLKKWLNENSKNVVVKKEPEKPRLKPYQPKFKMGVIKDIYVINQTTYNNRIHYYKTKLNKEYYQGKIYYDVWKSKEKPLPWNYHAEIISNPIHNTKTAISIEDKTFLPDGYKLLIESGYTVLGLESFKNIELLFQDDTLISFKANVDTVFHRVIERRIGAAHKIIIQKDTLPCPENKMVFIPHSKKRQHSWEKNGIKMETTVTEYITSKCTKRAKNVFMMYDEQKYRAYLNKVKTARQQLQSKK